MEELIVFGVLLLIFGVLYKKGLIRFTMTTYGKYKMKRYRDHVEVSYKKFDGLEYYYFTLSNGRRFTMTYSVIVERGTVTIELRSMKGECFKRLLLIKFESNILIKNLLQLIPHHMGLKLMKN